MLVDIDFNLAQVIGLIASVLIITAFNMKHDDHLKNFLAFGNIVFAVHFFLLGAHAGALVAVMNFLRAKLSIKFHKSKRLMFMFITLYIVMAIFSYDDEWISILPFTSGVLGTFSLFMLSGIKMRSCAVIGSIIWMTHNTYFMSIGGIITEAFLLVSNMITIYRIYKDKKKLNVPI